MARYAKQGVYQDGLGNVISGGTVTIYLAGTTTLADIYAAETGGSPINSVTTGTDGSYIFYADTGTYNNNRRFDIKFTKTNYLTKYQYNVKIYPDVVNKTPASAIATGIAGEVTWDDDYIYICIDTDTWKRVAISTWP